MAFTYTVTGAVGSKVLTVTSPDNVTIDIRAGAVRLTQDGSTYETVAALTDFGVGGIPVQTVWNGVATANVVPNNYALGNTTFLGLFANGSILEANATGMTSGEWTNLSQNLVKLADESLADLTLTNVQFSEFSASSSNVAALDPVLSNVSGDVATVTAIGYSVGATINASNYDLADFNLVGSTFSDTITGGAGNDNIYNTTGDTGTDILVGGAGNDTITGGSGNDTITGGADADKIVVDYGTDVITDLGDGADILVVQAGAGATAFVTTDWTATSATQNLTSATITLDLSNGVDVNLRAATATSGGYTITADGNSAASIVVGSTNADIITGGSGNDELRGALGADSISGGVGNDAIYGGADSTNTVTGGAGADTFTLNGTTDTVTDLGVGADVLVVSGTTTVVNAAVLSDWTATAATSHIGGGTVTLTLGHGVDVDLRAATGDHGYTIVAASTDASNVTGSNFADIITGGTANDQLRGAQGNDTITGGSGNDIIYGGAGADTINVDFGADLVGDLGLGADNLVVNALASVTAVVVSDWTATSATKNLTSGSITLDLNEGVDVSLRAATATSGGYTITADGNAQASVIVGSNNADTITGGSGNDELRGALGVDSISGGAGDDAIFGGASSTNTVTGGAGADTFTLNGTTDTVTDLGVGADVLVVSGTTTAVNAAVLSDWTATAATLNNSVGTVTLDLGNAVDVNLRAATGAYGYAITADGNSAASIVVGSNFADVITGGGAADVLRGAQGADTINGGTGNDVLYGGADGDTFQVASGADTIRDLGLGADNLVVSGGSVVANVVSDWTATATTTSGSNSVSLYLDNGVDVDLRLATGPFTVSATNNTIGSNITGSNAADTLNGSAAADQLRGAQGADVINGNGGDDFISGGQGADTLSGGQGADTFAYATNSTGVTVAEADKITDFYNVEDLISTGIAGLTSADIQIVDGTAAASVDAFLTAAGAAFAAGKDVYVSYNQAGTGDAMVAINNNGYADFTTGDSLIKLVGVNQASEISASNFIA